MSAYPCPDCGGETHYQIFSGGREWYCTACEANGDYPQGEAPPRAQMLQDGRFDELRADMEAHLDRLHAPPVPGSSDRTEG